MSVRTLPATFVSHVDAATFGRYHGVDSIARSGSTHDMIQFAANDFGSFAAVGNHTPQVDPDETRLEGMDLITLAGVKLSNLVSADFTLCRRCASSVGSHSSDGRHGNGA